MREKVTIKSERASVNICGTSVKFENGVAEIPFSLFEKAKDSMFFEVIGTVDTDEESYDKYLEDLNARTVKELQDLANGLGIDLTGIKKKHEIILAIEGGADYEYPGV